MLYASLMSGAPLDLDLIPCGRVTPVTRRGRTYGAREPMSRRIVACADFGGPEGPRIDPWTLNVDRTLRRSPVMCVVGERDEAGDGLSVDGSVHTMRPPKRWTVCRKFGAAIPDM